MSKDTGDKALPTRLKLKWTGGEVPIESCIHIGRDPQVCKITLAEAGARVQCAVWPVQSHLEVVNVGDAGTVELDGYEIRGRSSARVGQVLTIASTDFTIVSEPDPVAQGELQERVSAVLRAISHLTDPQLSGEAILDFASVLCRATSGAVVEQSGEHQWVLLGGSAKIRSQFGDNDRDGECTRTMAALVAGLRTSEFSDVGVTEVISDRQMYSVMAMTEAFDVTLSALVVRIDALGRPRRALLLLRSIMDAPFGLIDRLALLKFRERLSRRLNRQTEPAGCPDGSPIEPDGESAQPKKPSG